MAEEFGERTQAPTPKRKQEAARQGDTLKSRDLATALVVLAGVAWVVLFGPDLLRACEAVMAASFRFGRADVEDFSPFRPLMEAGWKLAPSLATLFAVGIGAALASQAALGSLRFNPGLLAPKASLTVAARTSFLEGPAVARDGQLYFSDLKLIVEEARLGFNLVENWTRKGRARFVHLPLRNPPNPACETVYHSQTTSSDTAGIGCHRRRTAEELDGHRVHFGFE